MRQVASVEELPDRRPHDPDSTLGGKPPDQLVKRCVGLVLEHPEDEVGMGIEYRASRLALPAGPNVSPCARFSRAQLPAVEMPIENRAAAWCVDSPSSIAATTRSRRSSE
jgi:hypothetical protein